MLFSLLKFSDENNIAKLVVGMWAKCSNRLYQSNFPNLILFNFFYFTTHKTSFQSFKPLFPVILWLLDLECHGQVSIKIASVKCDHVFIKFRKLKSLQLENKKNWFTWNLVFSQHKSFPILWAKFFKKFLKWCSKYLIDVIRLEFGLFNWFKINMVFKSSCSSVFYKIGALKNFAKFTWKHVRS